MARPNIIFEKKQGANRRAAPGQDFISGMVFYTGSLPIGFTSTTNQKLLYSLVDAENAGITSTYTDETKATGSYTVSAVGSNGDTIALSVLEPFNTTVNLGTYTKVSGDTTVTKVGDGIAAAINAGTLTHGYTAVNLAGAVTITARTGLGIFLNSGTPLKATVVGTIAGTLVQFSGGVASKLAVYHYHIKEYFRGNPNSQLYVGFYAVPSTYTYTEITTLQSFANGAIRQVGVFKDAVYAIGDLTVINTEVVNNDVKHKPLSVLYAANLSATTDITTVVDLSALSNTKVSSIIGQDGAGLGALLYLTTGKSVTQLGIALGMLSYSNVSEDFGNPARFNISDGTENNVPAFANGQLLSELNDSALDAIDLKRHIFGLQYIGLAGTFFNENHCACSTTNTYAYINDNRVIDKAIRGIYTSLIPYIKGKVYKNADGTLTDTTVAFYQSQAIQSLYQMERDGDLSTVSDSDVYIDPSQNIVTSGGLTISVLLNGVDIIRNMFIPITFK